MQFEHVPAPYRQLYELLLRFYPKPYRERFGPEMGQVFNDLCRERTSEGKGLFTFVLWMFGDTFMGLISVRISYLFSFMIMHAKHILRPVLITAGILLIPAVAKLLSTEMQWGPEDFIVMGALIFAAALTFEVLAHMSNSTTYRVAAALAAVSALGLYWVNLAVGIIGDGEHIANLFFMGVPFVAVFGALIVWFKARGMAYSMFAAVFAIMAITAYALTTELPVAPGPESLGSIGVIGIAAFLAAPWAVSGLLFLQAAKTEVAAGKR